jgi:predicted Zn-dependent protease
MKRPFAMFGAGILALLMCSSGRAQDTVKFTTADLEKMVAEISKYLPEDPRLNYPVKCFVVDNPDVNANASAFYPDENKKEGKPTARMRVYTGLFKWMNNDIRLVRAVVAHELAHLSKKHLGSGMKADDLDLVFTRQKEYEADTTGAAVLEKCGYSRKDMTDMLLRLGEVGRTAPASIKVMGDHADCQRRAAAVDKSNLVLRSMVSFTTGEAYMDVRAYNKAKEQFDKAVEEAPDFYEAKFNAAQAALLFYYDNVDPVVKELWYQPDFGASLLLPLSTGKAGELTPQDQSNYAEALRRIRVTSLQLNSRSEATELLGLALVLDPDGKPAAISEGIATLEKALTTAVTPDDRLRITNNLAIGYQRQGNVATAIDKMLAEQKKSTRFNAYLAANLGAQPLPAKVKGDEAKTALNVLYTFLSNTNDQARGYSLVQKSFEDLKKRLNLTTKEISRRGIPICRAFSLTDNGRTVFMLDPFEKYYKSIGVLDVIQSYSSKFSSLLEFVWQGGNFSILTDKQYDENDKNDGRITPDLVKTLEVIRVTSYNPGAFIEMRSADDKVDVAFRVTVGMSIEEFNKFIDSGSGQARQLIRNAAMEEWIYFQGLNFGIFVKDKKVAGVTVCPLNAPED